VTVTSRSGAIGDQRASEVDKREMVLCEHLPADAERAEVVVPAVGTLDDPAPRPTDLAALLLLTTSTKVQLDSAARDLACGIVVVVPFVEAEIPRSAWTARCMEWNSVERLPGKPLVVDVGAGQRDSDGNTTPVGQDVAFRAKFSTICRIGPGEAPPLGAFTEALSREHQFQSIPRFSS
jgi:hypothetical protein